MLFGRAVCPGSCDDNIHLSCWEAGAAIDCISLKHGLFAVSANEVANRSRCCATNVGDALIVKWTSDGCIDRLGPSKDGLSPLEFGREAKWRSDCAHVCSTGAIERVWFDVDVSVAANTDDAT